MVAILKRYKQVEFSSLRHFLHSHGKKFMTNPFYTKQNWRFCNHNTSDLGLQGLAFVYYGLCRLAFGLQYAVSYDFMGAAVT